MKYYSAIMTEEAHLKLFGHLIREDGQEDLCFATYNPSSGQKRLTGIISEIILPQQGERNVHGNVGLMPAYLERALEIAERRKEGLILLHSHPWPGWQGMSTDDVNTETKIASAAQSITGLPLLGMTLGTDGAWSARFWLKHHRIRRRYVRHWCEAVRVLGKGLKITYNDNLIKPYTNSEQQLRTISAWGEKTQQNLSRLKIGIVGLGSVGSIVAEILSRIGIVNFALIDFDLVEEKNLDRLTNVFKKDIERFKVNAIASAIKRSSSAGKVNIECNPYSICEKPGYLAALDCDLLFCCVDRPWGRETTNAISYAHLIPVIDGGIMVRTNKTNTKIVGADWKAHAIGYKRPCLECLGQYKAENAVLERGGFLDDPAYIQGMEDTTFFTAHENVYSFSSHLASMEVLQMLSMFIAPSGIADVGQQVYHFVSGEQDTGTTTKCHENCFFPNIVGKGDNSGIDPTGQHMIAEYIRKKGRK